jgi:hypothetical protein
VTLIRNLRGRLLGEKTFSNVLAIKESLLKKVEWHGGK